MPDLKPDIVKRGVSVGYLILVHRYPGQLFRLIERLDCEHVFFFIHVDKRAERSVFQLLYSRLSGKPNVRFIKRYKCYWAGFGIVQATLQGIKEAVESNFGIDHLVLLSGQDYPIKTKEYIRQFLLEHKEASFVDFSAYPRPEWPDEEGGWWRVKKWNIIRQNFHAVFPDKELFRTKWLNRLNFLSKGLLSVLPTFERTFPMGLQPYGGAQFWCLAKKHYTYVNQFVQEHPEYVNFFRYAFSPDETLIQTIIGNSAFKDEVCNDTMHFLEYDNPGAILTSNDKESIRSTYHLFARKFDATVDSSILDFIDEELLENYRTGETHVLQQNDS